MPDLAAIYDHFKDQLVVLSITDEDAMKVSSYVGAASLKYPILLDPGRKVAGEVPRGRHSAELRLQSRGKTGGACGGHADAAAVPDDARQGRLEAGVSGRCPQKRQRRTREENLQARNGCLKSRANVRKVPGTLPVPSRKSRTGRY
jgi:hypothetical protein